MPDNEKRSTVASDDDPEEMIRAAFPRAEAPEALRRRVAQVCRNAAPARRESWLGRFGRRRRVRRSSGGALPWTGAVWSRAGAGLLAAALVGGAMLASRRPAPTPPAAPTAGELIIRDPQGRPAGLCPLEHTDVNADIAGNVARVHVYQQFHNPANHAIEAVYTFPFPDDAAV